MSCSHALGPWSGQGPLERPQNKQGQLCLRWRLSELADAGLTPSPSRERRPHTSPVPLGEPHTLPVPLWEPHTSLVPTGGPGAVDRERRPHAGQQRPHVHAAADPQRPDPHLLHPADLPLHVGEQAHGGHCQGTPAPAPARVGSAHCRAAKAPCRALCLSQNSD